MNHSVIALAFQEAAPDSYLWIIIIAVIAFLFFIVVVVVVGLVIFFLMRKRKKAQLAASSGASLSSGYSPTGTAAPYSEAPAAAAAVALDTPPPLFESPAPMEEVRADVSEAAPAPTAAASDSGPLDFDPSRTVAITKDNTVTISYGWIKFISGALAGQQFDVKPEGAYIGREASLSQIVVADPRISKRHLWIGVRNEEVKIIDQDSRNGTFVNDPKSDRITEARLHSGDTVILGESDVARFEYQM
ncbi:MAG TPA: FHA domain-containing protein [Pyrinomonadaceae bacterium]